MEVEVLRVLQPALESFVEVCISLLVHFKAMNSSGLFRPILIICDQRAKNRLCDTSSITVRHGSSTSLMNKKEEKSQNLF